MGCCTSKEEKITTVDAKKRVSARADDNSGTHDSKDKKEKRDDMFVDPANVSSGKVEDFYSIHNELGRGTFSVVYEATHKETGVKYALKFIDKKYVDKEVLVLLSREIEIMKRVSHPNVLCLKEMFETPNQISLVLELVAGGELFFKIVERGSYSEKDASSIVRQIAEGVMYLHARNICHRDLKPENLLVSTEDGKETIKIADFGLSKIFSSEVFLETSCGTPDYAAPEVLTGESAYDNSVDLWSIGVITYVLLCGYPPFYASSHPALFEKIINCNYSFPDPEWGFISEAAKDFIRNLLVLNPKARLTAAQCLEHPFLKGEGGTNTINATTFNTYNANRKKQLASKQTA